MVRDDENQKSRYYVKVSIYKVHPTKRAEAGETTLHEQLGPPQILHCNDFLETKRLSDLICNIRLVDPKLWPLLPTFIKLLQQFRNVIEFE